MAVMQPQSGGPGIEKIGSKAARGLNHGLAALENYISWQSTLPILGLDLQRMPAYREADIIHFQVFHDEPFISLLTLPRLCHGKKVVFTLHDMWTFTGHCLNSMDCDRWQSGCGSCPHLRVPLSLRSDTTNWNWKVKRKAFSSLDATIVVASQWMMDRVKASPILGHLPVVPIPFGIDLNIFQRRDRHQCRSQLGLPDGAFVITFRSTLGKNDLDLKGTRYLIDALLQLDLGPNVYLVSFDRTGLPEALKERYPVLELGWISDPKQMAAIFGASNLFVLPSLADSFSVSAVEALACGTAVITFDGTAVAEVIQAPQGGLQVPSGDTQALAQAIRQVYLNPDLRTQLCQFGLALVKQKYSFDHYYHQHLKLYQSLMDGSKEISKEIF